MSYPKHYCGIVGAFGVKSAALKLMNGLHALQHRGQEGAGLVVVGNNGKFHLPQKGMGLVLQVFTPEVLSKLVGTMGAGHVRYSTTGGTGQQNVQPLVIDCWRGQVALAHNGNLVNTASLRSELLADGVILQSATDSEFMLHLLARSTGSMTEAVKEMMARVEGAYSLVIITSDELIGVRDPNGFRPLCLGKIGDGWVLASETCALDIMGAKFVREVLPGEIVSITKTGLKSEMFPRQVPRSLCIFEYVYFGNPGSMYGGRSLHSIRVEMGRRLWAEHPLEAGIVVPIPDGGVTAALGYSRASGILYEPAFVRNHYVGRSFLQPSTEARIETAHLKLSLIGELVAGKRVVVIDDSIVRGTTCQNRVRMLREAGAKEVHVLISCPPHLWPCHYGIDFPDRQKLFAVIHSGQDELRQVLGVDSLGYLSEAGLMAAVGEEGQCMACFNGKYPVPVKAT